MYSVYLSSSVTLTAPPVFGSDVFLQIENALTCLKRLEVGECMIRSVIRREVDVIGGNAGDCQHRDERPVVMNELDLMRHKCKKLDRCFCIV